MLPLIVTINTMILLMGCLMFPLIVNINTITWFNRLLNAPCEFNKKYYLIDRHESILSGQCVRLGLNLRAQINPRGSKHHAAVTLSTIRILYVLKLFIGAPQTIYWGTSSYLLGL